VWELARRPRRIAALVLCLVIAGGFAALGQWQLSRSIDAGVPVDETTETPVPLAELAVAQQPLTSKAAGRRVTVEGTLVPNDYTVLSGRLNDGDSGFWVVGHLVSHNDATDQANAGASLAVALGWAATEKEASSAISSLNDQAPSEFGGRYLPSEYPQEDDFENGEQNSMSTAALVNQWREAPTTVYAGYLVTDAATDGLDQIDAPAPSTEVSVNWLNIFYAVEWAVFAGFAIFLWFRLVKDAWEREQEESEEATEVN
jgi:surfeit locus 1 family protein